MVWFRRDFEVYGCQMCGCCKLVLLETLVLRASVRSDVNFFTCPIARVDSKNDTFALRLRWYMVIRRKLETQVRGLDKCVCCCFRLRRGNGVESSRTCGGTALLSIQPYRVLPPLRCRVDFFPPPPQKGLVVDGLLCTLCSRHCHAHLHRVVLSHVSCRRRRRRPVSSFQLAVCLLNGGGARACQCERGRWAYILYGYTKL